MNVMTRYDEIQAELRALYERSRRCSSDLAAKPYEARIALLESEAASILRYCNEIEKEQ